MLGGDWSAVLNRAGRGGVGESVLNTAVLCTALRTLADLCRGQGVSDFADRAASACAAFSQAVGDTFVEGAFLRAYTDAGSPVGDPREGPVFLDVQAWAVLGRCGTVTQRKEALDTVLNACQGHSLTVLTKPFPV